ncbi:hypothetical protein [Rhizobium ruizarguesonis]|uniref:hypothetical protein n=1 Tax=Rhizobium ruizarguesonis TaxID=2081791 RepID=UPI001447CE46|nr:hypothetical protein [Rhizobium ruizarguesonis]
MEFFLGALALLSIALKLLNKITWSWGWVLAPLWGPLLLAALAGALSGAASI